MATLFYPGQTIGRTDLSIYLTDSDEHPTNAYEITYAVYWVDPGPPETEVLIGLAARTPVNPTTGEYYASLMVPPTAVDGDYRIRWSFKQYANSATQEVVQSFTVVATADALVQTYSRTKQELIDCLRMLLRDQNPDKFYHFRPPEHEGRLGKYDRVFGQIWEDAELCQYLERSLDWFNMFPPSTGICTLEALVSQKPHWRTAIYWGAIVHALFALGLNWIADEFDYSIGGVSLSIDKSSKYQSMMNDAESKVEKSTEAKARTEKYIRGLQQPKYGLGIRSAFGPHTGRGVLSPRNFL